MDVDLKACIVRILKPDGTTAGTGFMVREDGLIATCAHVVEAVRAAAGSTVRIIFHATGEEATVTVESEGWRPSHAEDTAFLRLSVPLPESVAPVVLGASARRDGASVKAFGYPDLGAVEGLWGEGELVGPVTEASRPLLQLRSSEITAGFSGGPVWDATTDQVIGMVTQVATPDRYGKLGGVAFAIPAETLAVLRSLQLAEADPLAQMRIGYLASLRRRLEYLDLGGIAPRVASRTVKLPLQDIYVPVEARRELDVQQAWQQLRDFISKSSALRAMPKPNRMSLLASLTMSDLEETAGSLAEEGEAAAWRIFQEQLIRERAARSPVELREVLSTPRAILLGHPGTGKSTSLRYTAYAMAIGLGDFVGEEALCRLPVLLRMVDYARARSSDLTLRLRDYVRDVHDRDRAPLFRHALERGECLVMLDGLDEITDLQQRAEIIEQIEALVADYPDNHYIVASRIVGYEPRQLTVDFAHYVLTPLPERSIQSFVRKWYEAIERAGGAETLKEVHGRADELCRAIEERPEIRRLAENPLLLTIIALVNWKGRKLPNQRVEVYRHAAETLVESWPRVRRGAEFDGEEVLGLLEPIAYHIFACHAGEEIRERDLLPLLAQTLAVRKPGLAEAETHSYAEGLLSRLEKHSGLFLKRGFDAETGERLFGFLHLAFAEYLTARYLARQWEAETSEEKRLALLTRYAHIPRWRGVVLLMVQHVSLDDRVVPATRLLADILRMQSPYEEVLYRDLLLAGQCLADDLRVQHIGYTWVLDSLIKLIVETPIEPLRKQITDLVRWIKGTTYEQALTRCLLARLKGENPLVRVRAIEALGVGRSNWAVEGLLASLDDDDAYIRAKAAEALGKIGSEKAVDNLQIRLTDGYQYVRAKAAEALGRIGCERAVDGLLARLSDPYEEVRDSAVRALGAIKSERAVDALLVRLDDESPAVRDSATRALSAIKSERAIGCLVALLDDRREHVCSKAAEALGKMGTERAVDGLLIQLENKCQHVRARAAEALGKTGSASAVDNLLGRLADENADVRSEVIRALAVIADQRTIEGLLSRLEDISACVRDAAAQALGAIRSDRAVDGLLQRLEDESPSVRVSAVEALGRIGNEKAVDSLLGQLGGESAYGRAKIIRALGAIKSSRAVDCLLVELECDDPSVRASAAEALGKIRSGRAVDGLLNRLEDNHEYVRAKALEALGKIGSTQAVDRLLEQLANKNTQTRARVVGLLASTGGERTVDYLLAYLQDQSEYVRSSTAEALGITRSRRAVDDLLNRLQDESISVRVSAVKALGRIGSERAVEYLLRLLEDDSEDVRAHTAEALREIKSEQAIKGLLVWLARTDFWIGARRAERACDWAYTTIMETLAYRAFDPGVALPQLADETVVPGPWSTG